MALMDGVLAELRAGTAKTDANGALLIEVLSTLQRLSGEIAKLQEPRVEETHMSIEQAAARYGIGKTGLFEILKMPEAPKGLKIGQRRVLPIADFDAFMVGQFSETTRARA